MKWAQHDDPILYTLHQQFDTLPRAAGGQPLGFCTHYSYFLYSPRATPAYGDQS